MHASVNVESAPLWAITSFYNPQGYWRRRHNYRLFRQHLTVPLLTVELSFDGRFELDRDDADLMVRCTGGDVLWQKERLLNIALARLPASCESVAWVDCDVVFQRPDWAAELESQLRKTPLVQPFSRELHFHADTTFENLDETADNLPATNSVASLIGAGMPAADCLVKCGIFQTHRRAPGYAWAARREMLAEHGLYDACITGGGDTAIAAAGFGLPEAVVRRQAMNDHQAAHYHAWAEPFSRDIEGNVGCLAGDIWHLWHGERNDRRFQERFHDLQPFAFDPAADIAHRPGGCWTWSSDKPALHEHLRNYFAIRNEDGADVVLRAA
jgi:hypothetical protein